MVSISSTAARINSNSNDNAKAVFTHFYYLPEPRGRGMQMPEIQTKRLEASWFNQAWLNKAWLNKAWFSRSWLQTSRLGNAWRNWRNTSWRSKPILSIRARLIVVALLAIAPLMLERMRGLERTRAERVELALARMADLARGGAEAQREVVYSVRALLQVVARIAAKMPLDPADCNRTLAELTGKIPWLRGVNITGIDGRITCTTDPRAIGLNVADRAYFQNALHSRDFSLSDYLVTRVSQVPGLIATYPIVKDNGSVAGVVLGSINLRWIDDLATSAALRSGTSVALVDSNGTLIAASPDEEALIGKNFTGHALAHDMLAKDEGAVTAAGFDGVRRIFAYVRVPWTKARLAVGLDESVAHSGIDREISIAYVQLATFGTLVLLAAWFGGERLILRPIRQLVRTATRFGRGDLRVRATEKPWIAEFEPLAVALNDMARKLAAREEELQIANQHLEELASLDGLTGLANRRGFDRELVVEWQRAAERGQPLALMMIDIDHFKLFNDRYGHVQGDACLRAVGETLSLVTLEEAVLVARYGGEEFALLLPGLGLDRASALAEEGRRAIEDLLIRHAEAACGLVTISIGVESLVPRQDQPAAELVEAADRALYAAKRGGRNTVVARLPAAAESGELV
jgi:diguanylate cyclase (GGDEF)-like protein